MEINSRRLSVSLSILSMACILFFACNRSIEGNYVYEADNPQIKSPLAGDSLLIMDDGTGIGLYSGEFRYEINSRHDSCIFYFDTINGMPLVLSAKIRYSIIRGYYFELLSGGVLRQFKFDIEAKDSVSTDQLVDRVLKGDFEAYAELYERQGRSALPYSILMANDYDNPQAAHDAYTCLIEVYKTAENKNKDSLTVAMAVRFLEKSARLNNFYSLELGQLYFDGEFVERDTIKAWECLSMASLDSASCNVLWKKWHEWYDRKKSIGK